MKKILALLSLIVLILTMVSTVAAAELVIRARLSPVGRSGVSGVVKLAEQSDRGTMIKVRATGLVPNEEYVSLYYDNHTCELEPYSEEDIIGTYTANSRGVGVTSGEADDDIDEINSVSVRRASDFALLACADVHPGR